MTVGPLRVPAGVVRLRPVRLRDAAQWSRIRIADRQFLEPWEPSADMDWVARHAVSAWPASEKFLGHDQKQFQIYSGSTKTGFQR